MSLELEILRDLSAGPSTADALALRVKQPTAVVEVVLHRLKSEGKLKTHTVAEVLTVYRLIITDH